MCSGNRKNRNAKFIRKYGKIDLDLFFFRLIQDAGDLVQLGGEDGRYYHTLFICGRRGGELLIAAHSFDAFERPLSSYDYARLRPIKIEGCRAVRTPPPGGFERLLSGEALPPGCF